MAITSSTSGNANLHIYLCNDPQNTTENIGYATIGSLCKNTLVGSNSAVVEKQENVLLTAEVNGYFIFFEFNGYFLYTFLYGSH